MKRCVAVVIWQPRGSRGEEFSQSTRSEYRGDLGTTCRFPLLLDIDPATPQPQVIRIPANDPSTFDGEELPPLLPHTGGGMGFF